MLYIVTHTFSRKVYQIIRSYFQYLEAEFNFWMTNRTIKVEKAGNVYIMGQYNTHTRGPRPESY